MRGYCSRVARREQQRDQTRQIILEQARRLFHEQGFEHTTVQQVARAADVAPQTVFNHAPTKEALFFLGRVPFAEALTRSLRPDPEQSWADALVENLAAASIGYLRSLEDPVALDMAVQIESTPSLARHERALHTEAERELGRIIAKQLPGTDGPLAAALLLATTRVHAHAHRQRLIGGGRAGADLTRVERALPRDLRAVLAVAGPPGSDDPPRPAASPSG